MNIFKRISKLIYHNKLYAYYAIPAMLIHEISHLIVSLILVEKIKCVIYGKYLGYFYIIYEKNSKRYLLSCLMPCITTIVLIVLSFLFFKLFLIYIFLTFRTFWISKIDDNNIEYILRRIFRSKNYVEQLKADDFEDCSFEEDLVKIINKKVIYFNKKTVK